MVVALAGGSMTDDWLLAVDLKAITRLDKVRTTELMLAREHLKSLTKPKELSM